VHWPELFGVKPPYQLFQRCANQILLHFALSLLGIHENEFFFCFEVQHVRCGDQMNVFPLRRFDPLRVLRRLWSFDSPVYLTLYPTIIMTKNKDDSWFGLIRTLLPALLAAIAALVVTEVFYCIHLWFGH
jgi:hypothetical protein